MCIIINNVYYRKFKIIIKIWFLHFCSISLSWISIFHLTTFAIIYNIRYHPHQLPTWFLESMQHPEFEPETHGIVVCHLDHYARRSACVVSSVCHLLFEQELWFELSQLQIIILIYWWVFLTSHIIICRYSHITCSQSFFSLYSCIE